MKRMIGQSYLRSITVRVKDNVDLSVAEQGITQILTQLHGSKDFFVFNTDSIRQTIEKATTTLALLVSAIAFISLLGGVLGVSLSLLAGAIFSHFFSSFSLIYSPASIIVAAFLCASLIGVIFGFFPARRAA